MNESSIEISIREYIKKLKLKLNLFDEYNNKLEQLINKKEELIINKNLLKEENNKKYKKDRNIIGNNLSNNYTNKKYNHSIEKSKKRVEIQLIK